MANLTAQEAAQMREMVEAIWGVNIDDMKIITVMPSTKLLDLAMPELCPLWREECGLFDLEWRPRFGKLRIQVDRWLNGARTVRVGCDTENMILAVAIQ